MSEITIVDYVPEEATPGSLIGLVSMLADEVAKARSITARYEAELAEKKKTYKRELNIAKVLHRDNKTPTIINALAETTPAVMVAEDELTIAEANLRLSEGRYDGVLAQYQSIKKAIDLKLEELRTFRG